MILLNILFKMYFFVTVIIFPKLIFEKYKKLILRVWQYTAEEQNFIIFA